MRELTVLELDQIHGGSEASYNAGYAAGRFVGKTLIASAVIIGLYVAFASA
jgi:predicted secreted protein